MLKLSFLIFCIFPSAIHTLLLEIFSRKITQKFLHTPGPHLMRIRLVRYSTSARYETYSIIHLVRPIIYIVRLFELSTS